MRAFFFPPTSFHSAFTSVASLSLIHLTDLDHVFVCRGTLDSVRDVGDGGVYANGHNLHGDGHGFSSEDGSVQYLRVLKTEKGVISHQYTGPVAVVRRKLLFLRDTKKKKKKSSGRGLQRCPLAITTPTAGNN